MSSMVGARSRQIAVAADNSAMVELNDSIVNQLS